MKEEWMVAAKRADFDAIASKFNIDKVLARIIRNRDLVSDEEIGAFLGGTLSDLHDPLLMKDMEKAVLRIREGIKKGEKLRVIGDYDVDGICATYILLKGLKTLGADVDTVIPHRIRDGYGLNNHLIEEAAADNIDTIITCDNGISAAAQIELACSLGMCVIVTDHHEVPFKEEDGKKTYTLPPAYCVVDPKREDCDYPFKSVCGAFVAFKLISVLLENKYPEVTEELIPFAAMATVCDVMELLDENRIIVKEGLKRLNAADIYGIGKVDDNVNIGLKAMILAATLGGKEISAYHFGFVLGPMINATGRLDTASRALELFSSTDYVKAGTIATELRQLNDERKGITEDGVRKASEIVDTTSVGENAILVIYLPECHESIAGIIAGRIKEKYYKPTIVITDAEDGVKGSGRSIEAYDMYAELTRVSDLFTKFGGHKMAAGLSLVNVEAINELRRRLNENSTLSEEDLTRKLHIDVPMPLSYVSRDLIRSFDLLEPFGTANPKPLFAVSEISILSYQKRGKTRKIGKYVIADRGGRRYDMVCFEELNAFDDFLRGNFGEDAVSVLEKGNADTGRFVIKIAYYPDINVYNGIESIQIVMKHYDI